MPPKKNPKTSKGKSKKADNKNEGETSPEQQRIQDERKELCQEANRISKLISIEDKDFNDFQQQREKLNYFWIVEKHSVEDKKAILRNKERESQDIEEKHFSEIKEYKHKLKHLLHEELDELSRKKLNTELEINLTQDDHAYFKNELLLEIVSLKNLTREMEVTLSESIFFLQLHQDFKILELRNIFERKMHLINQHYEGESRKMREASESIIKQETSDLEQSKNEKLQKLVAVHEKSLVDIIAYFSDITKNNFEMVQKMKDKVKENRRKERLDDVQVQKLAHKIKGMKEPLKQAQEDLSRIQDEMDKYNREKDILQQLKSELEQHETQRNTQRWKNEILVQRHEFVKSEYVAMEVKADKDIREANRKVEFTISYLENQIYDLDQEENFYQILKMFSSIGIADEMKKKLYDDIADELDKYTTEISEEVVRNSEEVRIAHKQLTEEALTMMKERGIPKEELGFVPLL